MTRVLHSGGNYEEQKKKTPMNISSSINEMPAFSLNHFPFYGKYYYDTIFNFEIRNITIYIVEPTQVRRVK